MFLALFQNCSTSFQSETLPLSSTATTQSSNNNNASNTNNNNSNNTNTGNNNSTPQCTFANGLGEYSKQENKCLLISCNNSFHKDQNSNACVPNTRDCNLNGANGNQTWNGSAWGNCTVSACPAGQHLENNNCLANNKSCVLNNGSGSQMWSGVDWGVCQAQSCNGGYHVEGINCLSDNKSCFANNKQGSQTWNGSSWTSCLTCNDSHTPVLNKCEPNYELVKNYASFFRSCWSNGVFTCPLLAPTGYIGIPDKYYGNSATNFQFPINYTGVSEILLTSTQVILSGSGSVGCQKNIISNGSSSKLVSIYGCTGNGPLNISISANSAKNSSGSMAPLIGPSTSVMVSNSLPSVAYTKATNLEYPGKLANQKFDFYYPNDYSSKRNIPIFIWIHGGGWSGGDKDADNEISEKIAKLGFFVINANYTLAPTTPTPYPQLTLPAATYSLGQDDINGLITFVKSAILQYNGDINKITIAGGSAGGHLALYQATRPENSTTFQCVISAAGPSDLVSGNNNQIYPVTKFIINYVFGNNLSVLSNNSPTYQIQNLKTNKLLLVHQLQDNLVPIDHALRMMAAVNSNKPGLALTSYFLNDTNTLPIFNPTPEQITHVPNPNINDGIAAYVQQECR